MLVCVIVLIIWILIFARCFGNDDKKIDNKTVVDEIVDLRDYFHFADVGIPSFAEKFILGRRVFCVDGKIKKSENNKGRVWALFAYKNMFYENFQKILSMNFANKIEDFNFENMVEDNETRKWCLEKRRRYLCKHPQREFSYLKDVFNGNVEKYNEYMSWKSSVNYETRFYVSVISTRFFRNDCGWDFYYIKKIFADSGKDARKRAFCKLVGKNTIKYYKNKKASYWVVDILYPDGYEVKVINTEHNIYGYKDVLPVVRFTHRVFDCQSYEETITKFIYINEKGEVKFSLKEVKRRICEEKLNFFEKRFYADNFGVEFNKMWSAYRSLRSIEKSKSHYR